MIIIEHVWVIKAINGVISQQNKQVFGAHTWMASFTLWPARFGLLIAGFEGRTVSFAKSKKCLFKIQILMAPNPKIKTQTK